MPLNTPKLYLKKTSQILDQQSDLPQNWLMPKQAISASDISSLNGENDLVEILKLTDEQKTTFLYKLNNHLGRNSTYPAINSLREAVKKLYEILSQPNITEDQKASHANQLMEGIVNCTAGFHDRVNYLIQVISEPQDLDELLSIQRHHLVEQIARQSTDEVHAVNRFFVRANSLKLGVPPLNLTDAYPGGFSDNTIEARLKTGFSQQYHFFAILNSLCDQLKGELSKYGYRGKIHEGEPPYENKMYERASDFFNKILKSHEEISQYLLWNEKDEVVDINWRFVKLKLLQLMLSEKYFTIYRDEFILLQSFLHDDTPLQFGSETAHKRLFPDGFTFIRCLLFLKGCCSPVRRVAIINNYLRHVPESQALKTVELIQAGISEDSDLCVEIMKDVTLKAGMKESARVMTSLDGMAIRKIIPELRADEDIVLNALQQNVQALQYASEELRASEDFMLRAITHHAAAFRHASDNLKNNPDFYLKAIQNDPVVVSYLPDNLRYKEDFVRAAVAQNIQALQYASESMLNNSSFILSVMEEQGDKFYDLPEDCLIRILPWSNNSFTPPKELSHNWNFMLDAIKHNADAFHYLDDSLTNNIDFFIAAVRKNNKVRNCISDTFIRNALYSGFGIVLQYLPENLQSTPPAFILEFLKQNPELINDYLPENWRGNGRQSICIKAICRAMQNTINAVNNHLPGYDNKRMELKIYQTLTIDFLLSGNYQMAKEMLQQFECTAAKRRIPGFFNSNSLTVFTESKLEFEDLLTQLIAIPQQQPQTAAAVSFTPQVV